MRSELSALHREYDRNFVRDFSRAFSECRASEGDRVWFVGPTAYLFSLAGVRFAVDLQIRRPKDMDALRDRLAEDCSALSFVLITHQHDDHMCLPLMRALKDLPIRWYLPADTKQTLIDSSEIPSERIVRVRSGERWQVGALSLQAFYSPHVEAGESCFPQLGYVITAPRGRLLMPADVRDYTYAAYPDFGRVDVCFSHLWGGNDACDASQYRPMLEQFAAFSVQFEARKYFLCHLYEIGREERFMWTHAHGAFACEKIRGCLPSADVEIPRIGSTCELFAE